MLRFNICHKVLSLGCLFFLLSSCTPQTPEILNTSCPEPLATEESVFSSSLYFTKNDGPYLYVFRDGQTYRIDDLEITPSSGITISPDGKRLLHYILPTGNAVDFYESSISIINLPLPSTQTDYAKTIVFPEEWPEYRGSGGWLDSQTVYFGVLGNIDVSEGTEMVVMNINDYSSQLVSFEYPDDMLLSTPWSMVKLNKSLEYWVYPGVLSEEADIGPDSLAVDFMVASSSNKGVHQTFLQGHIKNINKITWGENGDYFIFQDEEFVWHRVDIDKLKSGKPYVEVFYEGIQRPLSSPSLSPDGNYLAAFDYELYENDRDLIILSSQTNLSKTTCITGNYLFQTVNGSHKSAVWDQSGQYLAFVIHGGEHSGLYILDLSNNTLTLIESIDTYNNIQIIGWGI